MSTRLEDRPAAAVPTRERDRWTWLAVGLFVFGAGVVVAAALGPLVLNLIEYHVSEGAVNQLMGGDLISLVLVAPVSVFAGRLVLQHRLAGPVLALGPAVYGLYMFSQIALGNDVSRYPGNSELFFPLYVGLFIVAGAIAIVAWSLIDTSKLPATSKRLAQFFGWFILVIALFLTVGLHLRALVEVWSGNPSTEYLADPVLFWLVKFMDLALVVPALVAVGVGVLRNAVWVEKARYAGAGWVALLGSSVAGMAIVMQASSDPAASVANSVAFGLFAVIGLAVAVLVYRPLFVAEKARRKEDNNVDSRT